MAFALRRAGRPTRSYIAMLAGRRALRAGRRPNAHRHGAGLLL